MDSVMRATAVYAILWMLFRIPGQRTLSDATPFDFVLLLIIAETTQQALLGNDFSVTNAFLLVVTLIGINILLSLVKQRSPRFERIMDGQPLVIVDNGTPIVDRMQRERIDESDILEAARRLQGLESMDQIKYAVLEVSGGISIIPR